MQYDCSAVASGGRMMENWASDLGRTSDEGLSARALLSAIRRHWALVLCSTLLMCAAGAFIGLGLPAWFQAEGVVVIPAVPQRIEEFQELPDPTPDLYVIQSQVDILQSRSVIEPVVRSLKLWEAPEFQKTEYPKGWSWQSLDARVDDIWRDLRGLPSSLQNSVRKQADIPSDVAQPPTRAQIDAAAEAYKGYLGVDTDGHSMTIRVSFRAWTPERAAAVVNAHIDSYRNFEVQTKVAAADRANSALRSKVAELRKQLQAAEFAVSRYREEHNLTGAATDRAGVSAQLAALNTQLITAQAELAESQARAATIGVGGGSELPEVVASGTISALRAQEAQLAAREADLSRYHGDQYPELQQVRASMRNLQGQIAREIGRGRAAALQLVERSRARERSLQQSITQLTGQLNTSDAGLQQLEGNAESIRSLLSNFEKREAETAANPALITANSIIASRANPSATSTSAIAKTLAFAGGFAGLTLGSLLSLFLELRDRGFRTSAQVQQHTGSLTVSATPRAPARNRKKPVDLILTENRSAFAEAFRVSWAKIQLASDYKGSALPGGSRHATILGMTSATSGEGKSLHAVGFARTAALAGDSVVLVDADLRRAGASRLINQQSRFTLGDLLQHRCAVDDVIAIEKRSGMHFVASLPSSDILWTNQELHRFYHFINELKRRFALVLVDLPPLFGVAETIRLATVVDRMVLIVRWARTERQFVQFALDTLRSANVPTNVVILNDIDLKAQRRRGYRDHTLVYADKRLYRAASEYRQPPASSETMSLTGSRATVPDTPIPAEVASAISDPPIPRPADPEPHRGDASNRPAPPPGSTIEKWYDKYHG
jgi:polysaccharide biosynthesis transport protein